MKRLFRFLAHWPLPLLHALGATMGWLAFIASPTYRKRFLHNAALAGYCWREVRAAVPEAGKLLAEAPRLWFGAPPAVQWDGLERISTALAQGRGLVLLTPHLGCFEVTAQAFAAHFGPITVLYRPARKAWLRDLVDTARGRKNLVAVPSTLAGVRQLLKALRAGETIGLLPDQVPPSGLGVWAPFFGSPAYTMTLGARLLQQTGAPALAFWGERLPHGRGYCIHVRDWPGGEIADAQQAAALSNAQMEALVREAPGQYLWGYERYKQPRDGGGV